jgi:hypothetical protein
VGLLLVGGRIALTPWADHQVRTALGAQPALRASFSDVSLFSFPPSAVFRDIAVEGVDGRRVLSAPRLEVHSTWREIGRSLLAHGTAVPPPKVRLRLVRPEVVVRTVSPAQTVSELRNWISAAPPAQVEIVAIERGRVLVSTADGRQLVCGNNVDAKVEQPNLADHFARLVDSDGCRRVANILPARQTALDVGPTP